MAAKTTRADALTWTLGAGVADTLQFLDSPPVAFVKLVNLDTTNYVWVRRDSSTVGGGAATVEGEGCLPVPPNGGSLTLLAGSTTGQSVSVGATAAVTMSIISVGAAKVCAIKSNRPYL